MLLTAFAETRAPHFFLGLQVTFLAFLAIVLIERPWQEHFAALTLGHVIVRTLEVLLQTAADLCLCLSISLRLASLMHPLDDARETYLPVDVVSIFLRQVAAAQLALHSLGI
jgi:hypothetical protein